MRVVNTGRRERNQYSKVLEKEGYNEQNSDKDTDVGNRRENSQ